MSASRPGWLVLVMLVFALPLHAPARPGAQDPSSLPPHSALVPLSTILASARRIAPGEVIDVELEYDVDLSAEGRTGTWVYEVEVLTSANQIVELEFDAFTGRLLEIEGAPWPPDVPRPAP